MFIRLILYLISAIIILSLIIIFVAKIMGAKALKKLLISITTIIFFLLFYLFNHNFNIFIKSNIFPEHTHTIIYPNSEKINIPLPANSVWLFKTPTDIYYSKYDVNKCKEFFDSVLNDMKHDRKIKRYYYANDQKIYTIEIEGNPNIEINLIGDGDTRRYGISDPNY